MGGALQEVLDDPELAQDPRFDRNSRRVRHDAELRRMVEDVLAGSTAAQVTARLDAVGIANARLRTMRELAEHPPVAGTRSVAERRLPRRTGALAAPPCDVDGRESAMGPIPAVGQHTDAVRAEFRLGGAQ
jgi:itaconate CoA-transferase